MILKLDVARAQLKMFSAVCANLVVLFLGTILATPNFITLTINIPSVILFWKLGIRSEEILENL